MEPGLIGPGGVDADEGAARLAIFALLKLYAGRARVGIAAMERGLIGWEKLGWFRRRQC